MAANKRFLDENERRMLGGFQVLADRNPFLAERVDAERAVLGDGFVKTGAVWHVDAELYGINPNLERLAQTVETLSDTLRGRLADGASANPTELAGYTALIRYLLYARFEHVFFGLMIDEENGKPSARPLAEYDRFDADVAHYLKIPGVSFPEPIDAPQLFAWGYQIRRAFHHTYRRIFGGSLPAAKLRADVWESIFTHDVQRYWRALYGRMGDLPTLILGESGTGKDLVARAIGLSRFIPFDAKSRSFASACEPCFHPVNLSALPSSLIESELFGHRRGSFTGAVEDRSGWFEICEAFGAIFLDEIGEFDPVIQVKLLRILQDRQFQRVGETESRRFEGKVIAATNRDLGEEMDAGRFRRDLYYRICADVISTPTLSEQIAESPEELYNLVLVLARRIIGEGDSAALADEVVSWVHENLGLEYPWPGNIRELEQCLRNVMIRGEYRPQRVAATAAPDFPYEGMTADEVLRTHCTRVYHRVGTYEEAARRLGLDRRTVKDRIDLDLLERLRG